MGSRQKRRRFNFTYLSYMELGSCSISYFQRIISWVVFLRFLSREENRSTGNEFQADFDAIMSNQRSVTQINK